MAQLQRMPPVMIDPARIAPFAQKWIEGSDSFTRAESMQFGSVFNIPVAEALAAMLGAIPVVQQTTRALTPPQRDCVEVGDILVIGSIRPQNYDVVYRPDGVRFAFDSKTLNKTSSLSKNFQNMLNDLSTQAANVHSRFPHAVVGFIVALPRPCLETARRATMIETLRRLAQRVNVDDPAHEAEALSLVVWNPSDGAIDPDIPHNSSELRIEKFSEYVQQAYFTRYSVLPPHDR